MSVINKNQIALCVLKAVEGYIKDMVMQSVEKPLIEVVMKTAGDNQTRAAELLGINRNTLRYKIKKYRIK